MGAGAVVEEEVEGAVGAEEGSGVVGGVGDGDEGLGLAERVAEAGGEVAGVGLRADKAGGALGFCGAAGIRIGICFCFIAH